MDNFASIADKRDRICCRTAISAILFVDGKKKVLKNNKEVRVLICVCICMYTTTKIITSFLLNFFIALFLLLSYSIV